METLHTIVTNFHTLANAPIDWSANGGVPWFLFMVASMAVGCLIAARSN